MIDKYRRICKKESKNGENLDESKDTAELQEGKWGREKDRVLWVCDEPSRRALSMKSKDNSGGEERRAQHPVGDETHKQIYVQSPPLTLGKT